MGAAASVDADVVQRIEAVFAFIDTSNFQTIDRAELGAFFERSGENGFDCAVRARKWILENDVALDKRVSPTVYSKRSTPNTCDEHAEVALFCHSDPITFRPISD
jgi:hypothetical protein